MCRSSGRGRPDSRGTGGRWQISTGGGTYPRWLPDGKTLICQSGDQLTAVPCAAEGDAFVAGPQNFFDELRRRAALPR
jgi:hypothetical protein